MKTEHPKASTGLLSVALAFGASSVVPRGPFPSSDMPERDPATSPTEPAPPLPPEVIVLDEFEDHGGAKDDGDE